MWFDSSHPFLASTIQHFRGLRSAHWAVEDASLNFSKTEVWRGEFVVPGFGDAVAALEALEMHGAVLEAQLEVAEAFAAMTGREVASLTRPGMDALMRARCACCASRLERMVKHFGEAVQKN